MPDSRMNVTRLSESDREWAELYDETTHSDEITQIKQRKEKKKNLISKLLPGVRVHGARDRGVNEHRIFEWETRRRKKEEREWRRQKRIQKASKFCYSIVSRLIFEKHSATLDHEVRLFGALWKRKATRGSPEARAPVKHRWSIIFGEIGRSLAFCRVSDRFRP